MQTNYYFLRQLTPTLADRLVGWTLVASFSQEKDELVLAFAKQKKTFYLKAVLKPDLACLVFPEQFSRARKNSVELFGELIGHQVTDVRQYLNDRCFSLAFAPDFTLLFKLHGNRSNVLLFAGPEPLELLNNQLAGDRALRLDALDRPLDQSYAAFLAQQRQVSKLFPTLGKLPNHYLRTQGFDALPPEAQWTMLTQLVARLEDPTFYVTEWEGQPTLSLLPLGEVLLETRDPLAAANAFYARATRLGAVDKAKIVIVRQLTRQQQQTETYLLKQYERLEELAQGSRYENLANVLMANLHAVPPRAAVVELFDFYRDETVRLKLRPELSAQKNAEIYYRKAKNAKVEQEKIRENTVVKEAELARTQAHLAAIAAIEGLKELRKYLKDHRLDNETAPPTPTELFKRVHFQGFDIWVGRNAKNNDLLTQKYAFREDLWLHARDVTGSHVIIRHQANKPFPQPVVERAAQLAAWYSKRKNDSLCPVIVTPKKFVRKPKGLPEGAVVVDKETVIMVVPGLE